MKISRRNIDDLKTERPDVTPPLPALFKAAPIIFYIALVGGIALSAVSFVRLRTEAAARDHWKTETTRHKTALTQAQTERTSVERQAKRASDVVSWIQGSRNLQPLVVAIVRSLDSVSSIATLQLARDSSAATQVKITLKLNTQSPAQLDTTLEKINALDFRSYNPNQTQARGEIDYEATLIHQGARSETAPPATTPAS